MRLSQIGYDTTIFAQNWFNNNEEMMEGVKTWLGSMAADFFDTSLQKLIPFMTRASVQAVTMLRSSLSMYLFFEYNTIFFSLLLFLTGHRRLLSE
jgi:hypothetical protein